MAWRNRLAAAAMLLGLSAGAAWAISQDELARAEWEIANAQVTAPVHVQIALAAVDMDDPKFPGSQPCTIRGTVERVFRGGLVVGRPVVLRENCIIQASALTGAIEYGFYYDNLKASRHMELYLSAEGDRILGHAGWIIKAASDQPQYPAPASVSPTPPGIHDAPLRIKGARDLHKVR
ncbi:MAG: hypothetical protein ACM3Q1_07705 [Bacteroidales bacterium]